jgi:hypothetical protein
MASMGSDAHNRAPGWFTRNVFNRIVAGLTRVGISVWGSRILEVRGRKTIRRRSSARTFAGGSGRSGSSSQASVPMPPAQSSSASRPTIRSSE